MTPRWTCLRLLLAVVPLLLLGCTGRLADNAGTAEIVPAAQSAEDLCARIDDALDFTYQQRRLNLEDHAAWQIIHGSLAFGRGFPVRLTREGTEEVSAVDHVLAGGSMKGWNLVRGDLLDEATQRRGVRAILEQGSKTGQGHADQWLGYLADCRIGADEQIVVEGETHTLADYIRQIELDAHRNASREFSWTLMALTAYRPTSHTWTSADGQEWSIEKLVEIELDHDLAQSPCGGMHRLSGLTIARNRHLAGGGELTGVWARCDQRIRECRDKARECQNPDGSLSSNYILRPGKSADLADSLGSAGHTLEFIVLASSDEELREPWIERAVSKMCELFRKTRSIDLECGALYHAAHGLVLYRNRVCGERVFPAPTAENAAAAE